MKKKCILTNDVETTSIWHNCFRDETGILVLKEGMPSLLNIYKKYGIKSTFFFTGYIAKLLPEVVEMIIEDGHEVASHGMSHIRKNGFDVMPFEKQIRHLSESKKILEEISGQEVVSFRAPALRVNSDTAKALIDTGYEIDSSIASQRFDMFMSIGGLKKLQWMFAPRKPYRTSDSSLFRKGTSSLIEIPVSASILPYIGTTMRIFPKITSLQRSALALESSISDKPIVFLVHPNEFIDESKEERMKNSSTDNYLVSLIQDKLRSNLKTKNLGECGLKLYEDQIRHFKMRNFEFLTIKEYAEQFKQSEG